MLKFFERLQIDNYKIRCCRNHRRQSFRTRADMELMSVAFQQ